MEELPTDSKMSLALYQYMCKDVVGSEKYVRTVRRRFMVRDRLESYKSSQPEIISGSLGEGVDIGGSDLDIMIVEMSINVSERTPTRFENRMSYFQAEIENVKHGYVNLRLVHSNDMNVISMCQPFNTDLYLSNVLFKDPFLRLMSPVNPSIHGPCCTDEYGLLDIAHCVHGKTFSSLAVNWISRSNNNRWPPTDVKKNIIKHGVLYVPIGVKGSNHEEFEWRISFSVAEKFLIYSFNHTQLLTYALMKILLKDVIEQDKRYKDVLCSYFIKTIMFWVLEETDSEEWQPRNLIPCFVKCFTKLIYCVQYLNCPHYFIPEINLFASKITESARNVLLPRLSDLFKRYNGWQCVFLSKRVCFSRFISLALNPCCDQYLATDFIKQSKSHIALGIGEVDHLPPVLKSISVSTNTSITNLYILNLSYICQSIGKRIQLPDLYGNKYLYRQYKLCQSYLLLSTSVDAVSCWVYLALLFYKLKLHDKALFLLEYCLSKCTSDKFYAYKSYLSGEKEATVLSMTAALKLDLNTMRNYLFVDYLDFRLDSPLLPDELTNSNHTNRILLAPRTAIHMFRFLCYYQRKDRRNCHRSIKDLQSVIEHDTNHERVKGLGYYFLGMAHILLDDNDSAAGCFIQSIEVCPSHLINPSYRRLSMLRRH